MAINRLAVKPLPKAPSIFKMLGPSFILLGLGLGSGEVILWPYLTSNYGMGVIWGALLGLTFQFFMNMEIERYALAHGESIFVGYARKLRWLPFWFILSSFVPWIWPGIVASSAALWGYVLNIEQTQYVAIAFLILMGVILTLGPVLYKTLKRFEMILIAVGVPSIFVISVILADANDWGQAVRGIVGLGDGYHFLPAGIAMSSFLAALAYAGAGGNLNLAQSFYVKEQGYGMGKYSGHITSLITGAKEKVSLTGAKFAPTKENVKIFKKWWRRVNIEHFVIFWGTGALTIVLLTLLAFTTTHGMSGLENNISFVIEESKVIGQELVPVLGTFFLIIAGTTLFGTQLTIFDASSRIISENMALMLPKTIKDRSIPKVYYTVLWLFILSGIIILLAGFTQPLQLLVMAAVMNAFAMFIHTGLTLWINLTLLDKAIRPNMFRIVAMILAFLFYGGFSIFVLVDQIF